MLGAYPLITFILTADLNRAKSFYGDTLGLHFVFEDPFAAVYEVQGTLLRLTPMPGHKPADHPILGWKVPDIAATTQALLAAGLAMEKYPFLEQDELGIWTAPDGSAKVVFFKDPDGNVLSLTQS